MSLNHSIKYKLVFLGDKSVGKSSISLRFIKNDYLDIMKPTIGAIFMTKKLFFDKYNIKFDIWDTSGQKRYHSLAPMYYRGANVAIVVYDITLYDSFICATEWISELQSNRDIFIILVGNKCDLLANVNSNLNQDIIMEYVQQHNIIHFLCSAKSNININEIFYKIDEILSKKDMKGNNIILLSSNKDNKINNVCY